MAERIALIDFGAGNLRSVENALRAAGAEGVAVTADPAVVRHADRIVLPGVGAFGACIGALRAIDGMEEALGQRVMRDATPFLGICVGMQMMARHGVEFGMHDGLGWADGTVEALVPRAAIKVPHMGWNDVRPVAGEALVQPGEAYFLHSYAFNDGATGVAAATTDHGGPVTAAIRTGTAIGVQFHPEKSQAYGLAFLARFLEWRP